MALTEDFFRSVLEQDEAAVVLCDLNHTIVYMNRAAASRYAKSGGYDLVGKSLMGCHNDKSNEMINRVVDWFKESQDHNKIYTFYNEKENKDVYMIALRDDDKNLIGYYERHMYRNRESGALYDFSQK
ncbi:MAG: PAS domain-containing protein [Clostridia bacterium]|nr:PAS domain-containing protein [Clostridia bacterium]